MEDYKKILDQYGIKYRNGTPEEVEESIQKLDAIVEKIFSLMDDWFEEKLIKEISHYKEVDEWIGSMRDPTPEERDSINNYIESISQPTGVNIFDLMDEYEKERSQN